MADKMIDRIKKSINNSYTEILREERRKRKVLGPTLIIGPYCLPSRQHNENEELKTTSSCNNIIDENQ